MSLAIAAQHLAATGRGDDTELVHMTKPEVAGLMALAKQHGGTLTRNPQTGLIEAGFLRSILPMIAGLGLTALSGGTLSPLMAAMMVGGGTTLATGNIKEGLLAGLGAYGGGGLGEGLMGAGATSLAGTVPEGVVPTVVPTVAADAASTVAADTALTGQNLAADQIIQSDLAVYPQPITQVPVTTAAQTTANAQALQASQQAVADQAANAQAQANAAAWSDKAVAGINQTPGASAWQGFKNLGTKGGLDALTAQLGGPMEALKTTGMAFAPALMQTPNMPGNSNLQDTVRPWQYTSIYNNVPGMPGSAANPFFTQRFTPQPTYVAGTIPGHAGGGLTHSYAQGGISNLGGYSDGGQLLRGPGDGVSDSIPAQIGRNQPARLAEGEFVIPARIVSELGNGSTDAGAKKLYQMLNRIQAGRAKSMRGKNAYAKNTNAARHMPA